MTALVGTAALMIGCGESRHANDQRPQVSTRVSVTVSPKRVIVQPTTIATGPERNQEIPQNVEYPEPPLRNSKGRPLDVTFVTANQTPTDLRLRIRGPEKAVKSATVFARSPGQFQFALPAGSYTISAAGLPEATPARLKVGSYRASSQNDVLTP